MDGRRELVAYFIEKYRETYSATFVVNWGRDMGHARRILTGRTLEDAKQLLDVVFDEYGDRWATRDYPRPSLGQVASWLGEKAAQIATERAEQVSRYDEQPTTPEATNALVAFLAGGATG
ncbi:MAG: hypothetical protein ACQEXV_23840 [Bacillota bacterium]